MCKVGILACHLARCCTALKFAYGLWKSIKIDCNMGSQSWHWLTDHESVTAGVTAAWWCLLCSSFFLRYQGASLSIFPLRETEFWPRASFDKLAMPLTHFAFQNPNWVTEIYFWGSVCLPPPQVRTLSGRYKQMHKNMPAACLLWASDLSCDSGLKK